MPPTALRKLSLVVVSFNEAHVLGRLKTSIDRMIRPEGVEVETILVDGGSRDETVNVARAASFSVVIERPGANIPACRNEGARVATGDGLAYIDADCEVQNDWLVAARPLLEQAEPVVLGWPAQPPTPGTWVQRAWRLHWMQKNPRREIYAGQEVVRHEGFRLCTTRNLVMNREVFEQVGGFDEELSTGEDTDFVFRAYVEGVAVLGLPTLQAIHHGEPATLGAFFKQQLWHANRLSYQRIMAKTGGRVGGNAPRYTRLFLLGLALGLAGAGATLWTRDPAWLLAAVPLVALIALPAGLMAARAREASSFPALCVIYAAYGLARALNLLGLFQKKPSWKS